MGNRYDVISITMDAETKRRVDLLAAQEMRTRSGVLAWLVNQEYARRTEISPAKAAADSAGAANKAESSEITQRQEATNEVDKSKS